MPDTSPSVEPAYIAQTSLPEHVSDGPAARAWFLEHAAIAFFRGAEFKRMTVNDDGTELLFEAWEVRPLDQGEPRWSHHEMEGS